MKRLENYILRRGYHPDYVECAFGEVYGSENFEDGSSIQTSKVVEATDDYVKTSSGSVYYLGEPYFKVLPERTSEFYLLKKGADAIHQLGNIKRGLYDAEVILVTREDGDYYIGNFADGFGFADVKFKKSDCRKVTLDELTMCDEGRMEEIKY